MPLELSTLAEVVDEHEVSGHVSRVEQKEYIATPVQPVLGRVNMEVEQLRHKEVEPPSYCHHADGEQFSFSQPFSLQSCPLRASSCR